MEDERDGWERVEGGTESWWWWAEGGRESWLCSGGAEGREESRREGRAGRWMGRPKRAAGALSEGCRLPQKEGWKDGVGRKKGESEGGRGTRMSMEGHQLGMGCIQIKKAQGLDLEHPN